MNWVEIQNDFTHEKTWKCGDWKLSLDIDKDYFLSNRKLLLHPVGIAETELDAMKDMLQSANKYILALQSIIDELKKEITEKEGEHK